VKKLLGIVVLGLILHGCAQGGGYGTVNYKDSEKISVGWHMGLANVITDTVTRQVSRHCKTYDKYAFYFSEAHGGVNDSALFHCSKEFLKTSPTNGSSLAWTNWWEEKKKEKAENTKIEEEKKITDKEKNKLAKMINKAKSTCKTLGFDEGTDKFSDCTLKLYSQEVDNIVALEVAKQQASGSSSSGSMTIYDPVRDRQNQIDRGMKMLSGGCTLGIDC
jgi:hypothetical protein